MTTNTLNKPKFPPKLTLIVGNKNYSSWSMRPWLALAGRGVPFSEVVIPLGHANTKQQILQYSPTGLVPALKYGNLVLWESLAIIEFAAEKHPEAKLWPEDVEVRGIARALACEVHSGFQALRAHCPMNLRRRAPRRLSAEADADLARLTGYWKRFRMELGAEGRFIFGEFGAIDAMFAPLASRIRSYELSVDRASQDYIEAIHEHPAFKKWQQAALAEPWRIDAVDNIDKLRPGSR